jgi:hypothetical protein
VKKTAVRVLAVINQGIPDSRFMLQGIFKNADLGREAVAEAASIGRLLGPRHGLDETSKHTLRSKFSYDRAVAES